MMRFEIINPSDEVYIEGDDFEIICIANAIIGNGKYALKQVDGDLEMPLMIFGFGMDFWVKKFGRSFEECLKQVDKTKLADCLDTVRLARERTSLNDIVGIAKDYAKIIRKKVEGLEAKE